MLTTGYICISRRATAIRDQYITVFLVTWSFLGNVVATLFLSDGPAFYARVTGDESRYGALVAILARTQDNPFSAYALQNALWVLQQTQSATEGSGISAFPSLHVAMATLVCLGLASLDRRLIAYGGPFLVSIFVGSIVLGWHYAVDGYASVLLVSAVWIAVHNARRSREALAASSRGASALRSAPGIALLR